MGLLDKLRDAIVAKEISSVPESLPIQSEEGVLYAPVTGRVVSMSAVPDPAFSEGLLGAGCGIWPESEIVFAPVTGTLTVLMGHAVGLVSDDGIEVLVHVGMDTVSLEGKGFVPYVAQGERVSAGQPLLSFSRKAIAEAGYEDCVVLVITNTASFDDVELVATPESDIVAGSAVVRVLRS